VPKPRTFKRKGHKTYRYEGSEAQAVVFGADSVGFWAYGAWGREIGAEGIEYSLARARAKANETLDKIEGVRPSAERKP
jgi:hypothetical protein